MGCWHQFGGHIAAETGLPDRCSFFASFDYCASDVVAWHVVSMAVENLTLLAFDHLP